MSKPIVTDDQFQEQDRQNTRLDRVERSARVAGTLLDVLVGRQAVVAVNNNAHIPWDVVYYDDDLMFDPTTPDRLTIKTPGIWLFRARAHMMEASGTARILLRLNDTDELAYSYTIDITSLYETAVEWFGRLDEGDFITVNPQRQGGAAVNVNPPASQFGAVRLGDWHF